MATRYKINGVEVTREEFLKNVRGIVPGQPPRAQHPSCWPMYSSALAVHPDDVPAAVEHCKKIGVPTDFNADGEPKLESRGHRKRFCKAHGYYDRSAGYGDHTPR